MLQHRYIFEKKKKYSFFLAKQESSLRDNALFTKFIVPPFFYILQNNLLMKSFV